MLTVPSLTINMIFQTILREKLTRSQKDDKEENKTKQVPLHALIFRFSSLLQIPMLLSYSLSLCLCIYIYTYSTTSCFFFFLHILDSSSSDTHIPFKSWLQVDLRVYGVFLQCGHVFVQQQKPHALSTGQENVYVHGTKSYLGSFKKSHL